MKIKSLILSLLSVATLPVAQLYAQTPAANDTITINQDVTETGSDRNVMLNATSATEPRQVAIGLPITYTPVTENGLPSVYYYWPNTTSNHWRNDASLSSIGLMKVAEVALTQGDIGYGVSSFAEMGQPEFKGKVNYGINHYGAQRFDMNLSGGITDNLYYTLGVYQNFDPGSFKLGFTNYNDRAQMYRAGLTYAFNENKGKISVMYKYANLRPLTSAASYAPFVYDGDGKVSELPGFKLGRDSYLPTDGTLDYIDVRTGQYVSSTMYDMVLNKSNELAAYFDYNFDNDISLAIKAKYTDSDNNGLDMVPVGVTADQTVNYALREGTYTGDIQKRQAQYNQSVVRDAFFTAELLKPTENHSFRLGINQWYSYVDFARSTTEYYHTVEANPEKVIYHDALYSNLNNGTEYNKGYENKLAAYFTDNWAISNKLRLYYGGRLEYFRISVDRIEHARFPGFYIGATDSEGQTIATQNYSKNSMNMAFSGTLTYNITNSFGLTGEATFIQQYRHLEAYSGRYMPIHDRRPFVLAQAGVFVNHPNISLVSALTYARRNNDYGRLTVVENDDVEVSDTSSGIETIGWTTDAVITPFKNFNLHLLFTLQQPKYSSYKFTAFGTGYDYGNKMVTGLSKVLVEIDPSYNITPDLRLWASFRYFSKQYANIANSIYFDGRWETFAGINYKVNKHVALSGTVVNFLNQKGAKGTIPGSDLISDGAAYNGTTMAGTYLRPLTFELSANITF